MTLLAIDTTGADCAVALRRAGQADIVLSEAIGRGHAERLAPMVEAVLAEAGIAARALERIGVTTGPGSFAGTRVGTAFARGLALASGAQALGIGNLAVIAHALADVRPLAVLHDAKRGELILQVWTDVQAGAVKTGVPERLSVDAVAERIRALAGDTAVLAGSGAALVPGDMFETSGVTGIDLSALLDLTAAADPAGSPASPFYARPPDAKLPGGIEPA